MKVFVATKEGQGIRPSDFFHSNEGDLVFVSAECGSDINNVDGGCGCRRCMDDTEGKPTTTFTVADLEMTKEDYVEKYLKYLIDCGRFEAEEVEDGRGYLQADAETILTAAETFPVGEVLERRGNDIQPRPKFYFTLENDEH